MVKYADGPMGRIQTYGGTASIHQQMSPNCFLILTCASNLIKYEWDPKSGKNKTYHPVQACMFLQRHGPADWKVRLKLLTDCIEIYAPYKENPTINGGKDIAVALATVEDRIELEEELDYELADVNDFV